MPSETVLAVTPTRPHSRAIDFISAITPARAAPTIDSPDSPTREELPTMAMMRPLPPFSRCGAAAWQRWIGAHQVDVDLAAPFVRRRVLERLADRKAGIADEDIEAAEVGDDASDHALARRARSATSA